MVTFLFVLTTRHASKTWNLALALFTACCVSREFEQRGLAFIAVGTEHEEGERDDEANKKDF